MNQPVPKVEVAFATDPNSAGAASPTWTDITNQVRDISLNRSGRTDELGFYQAGTASLTLRNADGRFNPANASGPYFGQLIPYRPIRITATWNSVTYPLWQGYVERWPQTWESPMMGLAPIECVDAFALLAQIQLDSTYAAEVLADGPTVYYPLGEGSGSTTAGNASANSYSPAQMVHTKNVTTTPGTFDFGQELNVVGAASQTGLNFVGDNANGVPGGFEDGWALTLPRIPVNWGIGGWTFELWFQLPVSPAQQGFLVTMRDAVNIGPNAYSQPTGLVQLIQEAIGSSAQFGMLTPNGIAASATLNDNFADGKLHHIVFAFAPGTPNGALFEWKDGVISSMSVPGGTPQGTVTTLIQLGGETWNAQVLPGAAYSFEGSPLIGTLAHFALYPGILSDARVQAHYKAGLNAFSGEMSGTRATRLLAYGGWQPAIQTIETGRSTTGPASGTAGTQLLSALQDITDAELGTLTVTNDGKVDFNGRDHRLTETTPTIIFGPTLASGHVPYQLDTSFKFDLDPTYVYNDVLIGRPAGITAESPDAASIVRYFPRQLSKTLNVDTDDQVQQAADFLLNRYKAPNMRLETLTVDAGAFNPADSATFWPKLLALDLHQRAQMVHQPLGSGNVTFDGFVEAINHTIDAASGNWRISTQLSPLLASYLIPDDVTQGFTDSTFVVAF